MFHFDTTSISDPYFAPPLRDGATEGFKAPGWGDLRRLGP